MDIRVTDEETGLYYLNAGYYDSEVGRFLSPDDTSYLEPEILNSLSLYAYCLNTPVMYTDRSGCSPRWWQWLISGVLLVGGALLCFVPGTQGLGTELFIAGGSMLLSNIMSAVGLDGKVASLVSSGFDILTGVSLLFTPFVGMGASLIGSGIGGIAGGYISESLGGNFELGVSIGNIAGSILGGKIYDNIRFSKIAKQGIVIGKTEHFKEFAETRELAYYSGMTGYKKLEKIAPNLTARLGWASNYHYISNVMKHKGAIVDIGGALTNSYGKEVAMLNRAGYQYWLILSQMLF